MTRDASRLFRTAAGYDGYLVDADSGLGRLLARVVAEGADLLFVHHDRVRMKANSSYSLLDLDPIPSVTALVADLLPEGEMLLLALTGQDLEAYATCVIDGDSHRFRIQTIRDSAGIAEGDAATPRWILGIGLPLA